MSHQVRVIDGLRFDRIPFDELFAGNEPVLMRGLTADWPLVQAARQSPTKVMDLLAANYNKKPVIVYVGDPEMGGRFSYNESLTGFNYRAERRDLVEVLDQIRANLGSEVHPYYYMNSIVVDESLPGLAAQNSLVFNHPVFDRYPACWEDLDRHRVDRRGPLRRAAQHCLLRTRASAVHVVPPGADPESVSGPARSDAWRPGRDDGEPPATGLRPLPAAAAGAG